MKHYNIIIELKSDLCAASGSGHGCFIDSDVCFDKLGFPYIPAKRLKGCLVDAANDLIEWGMYEERDKTELFGKKGSKEGGSFSISNAYIEDYKEIYNEIDERNSKASDSKDKIKRSDIINYFTSTRTRTAIDEGTGTARDGSLRTIRVINCIDPIKKEKVDNDTNKEVNNNRNVNRVFIAEVSLSDSKYDEKLLKKYKGLLENCCKALRHMGSNRTRGLGAVKLCLEEKTNNENPVIRISDKCKKIKFQIRLDSPIMISSNKASESLDYIPGSTVLGYFAGQYLKTHEANKEFNRLFVNGQDNGLKFSNFYISDKNNARYFPTPVSCKKSKKDGTCYNSTFITDIKDPFKDLTGKYIRDIDVYSFDKLPEKNDNKKDESSKENKIDKQRLIEVKKEVFYHHARPVDVKSKKDEDKEENKDKAIDTFYQYNAISADQYFIGEIEGKSKDLEIIVNILKNNNWKMRIGKSKTAQYGSVSVVKYKEVSDDEAKITINKNSKLAVVAQSHIMLLDGVGNNIIKPDKAIEYIAEKLFDKEDSNKYAKETTSFIKIDQIGGYNRKWNLERPPVPVIAPGSVFTFTYTGEDKEIDKYISIGERQNEGLGKMYVWLKDASKQIQEECGWNSTLQSTADKVKSSKSQEVIDKLINNIQMQENLLKLKNKAIASADRVKTNAINKVEINSTTINNLLLKLMNSKKISEFEDFVKAIKDTEKRGKIEKLLYKDIEEEKPILDDNLKYYYINLLTQCKLNIRMNDNEKGGENND